jgi:hypothetical protein
MSLATPLEIVDTAGDQEAENEQRGANHHPVGPRTV